MIKGILFDWDGTLAKTLEVWLKTFIEAFSAVGVHPSEDEISRHFGNLTSHIDLGVPDKDHEKYFKALEAVYDRLKEVELYDDVKDLLCELKKNYKIGLVTSSNRNMINDALMHNGLNNFFDVIISQEDTVNHKPDPEPLLVALDKLGLTNKECVFVGDSDKDTGAALNAGIPMLLFAPSNHKKYYDLELLKNQASVIESFENYSNFRVILEKHNAET